MRASLQGHMRTQSTKIAFQPQAQMHKVTSTAADQCSNQINTTVTTSSGAPAGRRAGRHGRHLRPAALPWPTQTRAVVKAVTLQPPHLPR